MELSEKGSKAPSKLEIINSKISQIKDEIETNLKIATENNQILITPDSSLSEAKEKKEPMGWFDVLIYFLDDVIEKNSRIRRELIRLNNELKL